MTTDLFKTMLQTDGEGIDTGDINDSQRFLSARLYDQVIESLIGDFSLTHLDPEFPGARGVDAPDHLAYALNGGSAYLRLGSAPNKLQITPGVLLQKVGNQTGNEPTLLAFSFAGTEEVSIAAGDAGNPRVDLVQMKLEYVEGDLQSRDFQDAVTGEPSTSNTNKKRRVQCTLAVKQGVPAASPTYPDPDAGYVAVAGVVVGTNYATGTALLFGLNSAGANAVVHDQRMPIRVRAFDTWSQMFSIVNFWSQTTSVSVSSSNVGNALSIHTTCGGGASRLVGIHLWKDNVNGFTGSNLQSHNGANVIPETTVTLADVPIGAAGAQLVPYYTIEGHHAPGTGPVVQQSAVNKIGPPVWSSGTHVARPHTGDNRPRLLWLIQTGHVGSVIYYATFFFAQGL